MGWLHVARIPGTDRSGAWLVVPGIHDPLFAWAMGQIQCSPPVKQLPMFGGWLVPAAAENLLWGVIAQTHGNAIICPHCFHDELPCEAWINLVTKRFETAYAEIQNNAAYQLGAGQRSRTPGYRSATDEYYSNRANSGYSERGSGYSENGRWHPWNEEIDNSRDDRRRNDDFSRQARRRSNYDPPRAQPREQPRPSVPKKPEPTREERLSSAARTLGITWPASKEQVKKAFAKAAMKTHPDLGGSDAAFIAVKQARDVLNAAV